ncbi:HAMP domain-containing sensor histidine kinase [Paenibacillus sp. IHBB 10380]|uniref:HAMP domain-containing sensor histidine kinase n=1 Tax=Paenibacillus sp. IHBB 10380 TaxID=1566358 RepID=UPI0005CFD7CF|nr:HAMP domain-containing sensor histidine kinase [Paenibacillus sp. IHBB 10380]AJS58697.1 histidine kinase [Paenibacillus sp. IHBB 10380]
MKFRHSLLARFLTIIMVAFLFLPLILPVTALLFYLPTEIISKNKVDQYIYANGDEIEKIWKGEAEKLKGASRETINEQLQTLHQRYPKSGIFWVNAAGTTEQMIPKNELIPNQWTSGYSIQFMKKSVSSDPFTVVSLIGESQDEGFMVIQIPRSLMKSDGEPNNNWVVLVFIFIIFLFFIFATGLLFYKIRKRLVNLREAMTEVDETGIPRTIIVHKKDEIGQLERAFNHMIDELNMSRQREQEGEQLRKQLITNLSHDLRTPLTTIRGHAYSLHKEILSTKAKESIQIIEAKVDYLGQLIENLLSYTLLSAGKYPLGMRKTDIVRIVRASLASWYPLFEKDGFEVKVCLADKDVYWCIDSEWFNRILDNLFQNVVRHARKGQYIAVSMEEHEGRVMLIIEDKGPGMKAKSSEKGAGIGLSIVSIMIKEMGLEWDIISSEEGTRVQVYPKNLEI